LRSFADNFHMSLYHLTLATDGRNPLCKNEEERRFTVRVVARIARLELVLFCVVDEHLHAVVWGVLQRIGQLRSALTRCLQARLQVPLQRSDLREVKTRAHLEWLVRYLVTQPNHHGLAVPPALWTGSCFQDLVGARAIDGLELRTREALPRITLANVCGMVGLKRVPEPAPNETIRAAGATKLLEAATAAFCAGPTLAGRSALESRVRDTVTVLGTEAGISTADLAWVLKCTPGAVRRHRSASVDTAAVRAVRVRLALEREVLSVVPVRSAGA
jgi:REP element-mobilizing transposase RayT